MTKQLNINSTTPVSLCIKELFKRSLHIKFKKSSLFYKVGSEIDAASGSTKSNQASSQLFVFDTSKTSHHGLIRIRDKNTKVLSSTATVQKAGEAPPFDSFDWRTIIAFRFPMDLNVEEISGYIPGMGWKTIDLRNRRFWLMAPQKESEIAEFNDLQRRLAQVRYERNEVKKARDNGKKRKFMENVTKIVTNYNDRTFIYQKKSGQTDKLFEVNGDEVKKVRSEQPMKEIALVGQFDLDIVDIPRVKTAEDVGLLAARFEILGEVEKHLSKAVREIELGLIEDYMIGINSDSLNDIGGDKITYGDVEYTIQIGDDVSYDYPKGTRQRWESGELEMRTVETNAQWKAREVVTTEVTPEVTPEVIT